MSVWLKWADQNGMRTKSLFKYYKSEEIKFQKRLLEGWPILKLFFCVIEEQRLCLVRYSILENEFDGVSRNVCCQSDRLVELGESLRGSLFFVYPWKNIILEGLKEKLDSKTDKRGVVESKCSNNSWLECLELSHGLSRSRGQKAGLWTKRYVLFVEKGNSDEKRSGKILVHDWR